MTQFSNSFQKDAVNSFWVAGFFFLESSGEKLNHLGFWTFAPKEQISR